MTTPHPAPEVPLWLEKQLPFKRYALNVGGHFLHVMEQEGDGVPVLMLHGNPSWSYLWRKVAGALKGSGLRLVMPDLLGLGLSDKPADPRVHTLELHGRLIEAVIDQLGLDRFVLAVQDWGGAIGGCAVAPRPERVKGLVVLNTVMGPPRAGFKPTAFHRFAAMPVVSDFVFKTLGFMPRGMNRAQGDKSSITGGVADAYFWPLRERSMRTAPLALARMVPDGPDHPSIPALKVSEQFVENFKGPAEIVWGVRDPVLAPAIKRLQKLLPHARVTRTEGGHFLQEEVPGEIAEAIKRVAGT